MPSKLNDEILCVCIGGVKLDIYDDSRDRAISQVTRLIKSYNLTASDLIEGLL